MSRLVSTVGVSPAATPSGLAPYAAWTERKPQVNGGYDLGFRERARRDSNPQPFDP